MASKKFNNPLEKMAAMSDPKPDLPSNQSEKPKPAKRSGRNRPDFSNPMETVSMSDVGKATGSSVIAGQYVRRTFTFTPGQLRRIKEVARELHIAETGIARWLIDVGLSQFDEGLRPELQEANVKLEPKLKEW